MTMRTTNEGAAKMMSKVSLVEALREQMERLEAQWHAASGWQRADLRPALDFAIRAYYDTLLGR